VRRLAYLAAVGVQELPRETWLLDVHAQRTIAVLHMKRRRWEWPCGRSVLFTFGVKLNPRFSTFLQKAYRKKRERRSET
jgi:hypothetical protein